MNVTFVREEGVPFSVEVIIGVVGLPLVLGPDAAAAAIMVTDAEHMLLCSYLQLLRTRQGRKMVVAFSHLFPSWTKCQLKLAGGLETIIGLKCMNQITVEITSKKCQIKNVI